MTDNQIILSLRQEAGLTRYALAKKTGLTQTCLRLLEIGESQPTLDTARRVADALGKSLVVFEGGIAVPRKKKEKRKTGD